MRHGRASSFGGVSGPAAEKPASAARSLFALLALFLLGVGVIGSNNAALVGFRATRPDVSHLRSGNQSPTAAKVSVSVAAIRARLAQSEAGWPLTFEPNRGQTGQPVKFLSHGRGYTLFLTGEGAVLYLRRSKTGRSGVRLELVGANSNAMVTGADELPGKTNYFVGSDPAAWRTNIPNYAKVKYEEVYPGVDLIYYGNRGEVECDFVVAPGSDPAAIRLKVDGAQSIKIDRQGDLQLGLQGGEVRFRKPQLYQQAGGALAPVNGRYVLGSGKEVGFEVSAYDRTRPLVIDPVLVYATYLGGSGNNVAEAVAVDASGNAYLTGQTFAVNFPTAGPIQTSLRGASDAFVTRLNPANPAASQLVYSTYLGGTLDDHGTAIAVDSAGDAFVIGSTTSTNFPVVNAFQAVCKSCPGFTNVFVTEINAAGSALVYSTYLGGTHGNAPGGIAVDAAGNIYVIGTTNSNDFPVANPIQAALKGTSDAFVTKINPANPSGSQLVYSTYLGGTHDEIGRAIAVDSSGNAYVTGGTASTDFPIISPAIQSACRVCATGGQSPFVVKINAAGSALVYATYLGGATGPDVSQSIAADGSGNAYVTGQVASKDFPLANPLQGVLHGTSDAFVTKINVAGSALVYSTYLGGTGAENLVRGNIAADQFGNAYATGDTKSGDFPTVNQVQRNLIGPSDAFVAMLNSTGSALFFSTYLGGNASDDSRSIAIDGSGNAYVAGTTNSTNFPTTANGFQTACNTCGMLTDGYLAKLSVPSFSIAASGGSTSATVTAGNMATYNLEVESSGGFSGTLSLSCGGTIPAGSCSASPTSLTLSGSSAAFTVSATTTSRATVAPLAAPPWPWAAGKLGVLPLVAWLVLETLLVGAAISRRRTRFGLACLILLAGLAISCSGGSSSPPPSAGTPAGTYTLTVTATSGAFANSSPLVLNVN